MRNVELFLALLIDVAVLTVQLYLSGGTSNPFAFLYLLQITLGAVLLRGAYIWTIVAITVACCFAALAEYHLPLALPQDLDQGLSSLYMLGLLVCFVAQRHAGDGVHHPHPPQPARARCPAGRGPPPPRGGGAHRAHGPAGLGRCARAGHARFQRWRSSWVTGSTTSACWPATRRCKEEIAEMQTQVQRCKSIVSGILLSAGETRGEASTQTTVCTFVDALAQEWREHAVDAAVSSTRTTSAQTPPWCLTPRCKQMVFNVLDNARDASPAWVTPVG